MNKLLQPSPLQAPQAGEPTRTSDSVDGLVMKCQGWCDLGHVMDYDDGIKPMTGQGSRTLCCKKNGHKHRLFFSCASSAASSVEFYCRHMQSLESFKPWDFSASVPSPQNRRTGAGPTVKRNVKRLHRKAMQSSFELVGAAEHSSNIFLGERHEKDRRQSCLPNLFTSISKNQAIY